MDLYAPELVVWQSEECFLCARRYKIEIFSIEVQEPTLYTLD